MKIFVIAVLSLVTTLAHAARIYEVEMLVFQHQADPFSEDEAFARNQLPEARPAKMLGLDAELVDGYITLDPYPVADRDLNAQADRLQAAGKRVLFHEKWLHGLLPEGQDQPIRIQGGSDLGFERGFELEGYVDFSIARFIQSDVDLALKLIVDGSPEGPVTPRLIESRRAKSGDLHYLDHPMFGVVLLYTRTEDSN